jgi:ABC-type nickel/cobalt efflux system permease component RcnA
MKLADGLRKHGFRRWYERQLLRSHAHLALAFLCLIGVFAAIEASLRFHSLADQLTDVAGLLVSTGGGLWALRRYLFLLTQAEATANQADCPACGTYGRLELVRHDAGSDSVHVRCRACGHGWRIEQ